MWAALAPLESTRVRAHGGAAAPPRPRAVARHGIALVSSLPTPRFHGSHPKRTLRPHVEILLLFVAWQLVAPSLALYALCAHCHSGLSGLAILYSAPTLQPHTRIHDTPDVWDAWPRRPSTRSPQPQSGLLLLLCCFTVSLSHCAHSA